MSEQFDFSRLARKWPSDLVARSQVKQFTGGLYSAGYLANLDSRGEGPAERVRIGQRVAYPVEALVQWLEARTTSAGSNESHKAR